MLFNTRYQLTLGKAGSGKKKRQNIGPSPLRCRFCYTAATSSVSFFVAERSTIMEAAFDLRSSSKNRYRHA